MSVHFLMHEDLHFTTRQGIVVFREHSRIERHEQFEFQRGVGGAYRYTLEDTVKANLCRIKTDSSLDV